MTRRVLYGLGGLAFVCVACSLVIDTSEIDAGCGEGMKVCGGRCVRIDDPVYGCSRNGCGSCKDTGGGEFGAQRIPKCENEQCITETCAFGFGCDDCSARLLSDPNNCGRCRHQCSDAGPDSGVTCSYGACVYPEAGAGGQGG